MVSVRAAWIAAATAAASFAADGARVPGELADAATCDALGLPDLAPFMAALPLAASPYGAKSASPIFLPVYASSPAALAAGGAPNASITTAVIFLHGLMGNANTYFCEGLAATLGSRWGDSTLVVAPWLGNESVSGKYWAGLDDGSASLFWSVTRWTHGGNASPGPAGDNPPVKWSTSFDALDALVAALTAAATADGALPALRLITVAGFSAGAQLAQHWAFARKAAVAAAAGAAPAAAGVPSPPQVRVLVSDPGSYVYLSPERPSPGCSPLRDTGTAWACAQFEVPTDSACADTYDAWKYGVGDGLDDNLYIAPLARDAAALAAQVAAYPTSDIRYVLGAGDACNCNTEGFSNGAGCVRAGLACAPNAWGPPECCDTWPDSTVSNVMDVTCEGMLQGSNRLQRGRNFGSHLASVFPGFMPRLAAFDGGHDASAFFNSSAFAAWAFDPDA
jgi:hypothetical protein